MKARHLLLAIALLPLGLADAQAGGKPDAGIDTLRAARLADISAGHRPAFLEALSRHIDKGVGFSYRKSLTIGERKMIFKLGGPVHHKRLGLGFQVRF